MRTFPGHPMILFFFEDSPGKPLVVVRVILRMLAVSGPEVYYHLPCIDASGRQNRSHG